MSNAEPFVLQIGVKAILLNPETHQFLAIKRAPEQYKEVALESFDIPGGRIDQNEALEQALAREIKEETGLMVTPDEHWRLLTAGTIVNQPTRQIVRLTYVIPMVVALEQVKLSEEHQSVQFKPLLPNPSFHPLLNDAISQYLAIYK